MASRTFWWAFSQQANFFVLPAPAKQQALTMKVIFLDIDGVLNCDATPNPRGLPYIVDKKLLARLNHLLDRTKAKVVLTSSWRVDPIGLFAARYWKVPFMDVCPDMPDHPRCEEICTWLKQHPKVSRYVVIDDDDDDLDQLPLFQPSGKTGLTSDIVRGVERYLSGKSDETMRAGSVKRFIENAEAIFKRNKS